MTIQEFYKELEQHDWWHMMSDDNRVDARGKANLSRLTALTRNKPEWQALLEAYSGYIFRTENDPKTKPQIPS